MQETAREFLSGASTTPLNVVWTAQHSLAVMIGDAEGLAGLTLGCFGKVSSDGKVTFSVYGTRVREEGCGLGTLLMRRLELAALEKCSELCASHMRMWTYRMVNAIGS